MPGSLMKALMRPGGGESTPSEGDQVAHMHESIFVAYLFFFNFGRDLLTRSLCCLFSSILK